MQQGIATHPPTILTSLKAQAGCHQGKQGVVVGLGNGLRTAPRFGLDLPFHLLEDELAKEIVTSRWSRSQAVAAWRWSAGLAAPRS